MSLEPLEQLQANLADAERVYECRKKNLDSHAVVAICIVLISVILSIIAKNNLIVFLGFLGVIYIGLMPASKRYPWSEPVLYRNERIK